MRYICFVVFCGFVGGMLGAAFRSSYDARADNISTQIVVDQQAGIIRFVIDDVEQARLDAGGLHVNGDINYTGTITDTGQHTATAEKREAR
jgi:hypothetical protein